MPQPSESTPQTRTAHAILREHVPTDERLVMTNAKASPNVEALSTSLSLAQNLPSDVVLDALKMILLGAPLNEVLTTITRLIEAHSAAMLCSIFLLDDDGLHLRYGVAASLPEAYRAATDGIRIGPNVGSCGTAACLRQPVFVSDIASDPKWVKFRDSALQSGLRGAWSTPSVSQDGKVLGTFCMYCREVRQPGTGEIQLIDYASRIAGIAIERDRQTALTRAFEEVGKSESQLRHIVDAIPQMIAALNPDRVQAEERTRNENLALREQIDRDSMFEDIVGSSDALRKVLCRICRVAPSDSTVLILGETGTGKELIARAIHKRSNRVDRAFIAVNCAAIPPSLIASELFGHEKGAFTGATQRRLGRFESANGGTIFLDEVGDLPAEVQIALLRVLQEREIERVGSSRPIPVDVRVLAATHRDLNELVAEGKFRQDLLYRLNVVPVEMPALRERAADIPLLVGYFIDRFGKKAGKKFKTIDRRTLQLFQAYAWPGNVRELQNVIERAVILGDGDIFSVEETWVKRERPQIASPRIALNGALLGQEKEMIEAALAESHGRISGPTGAAANLGLPSRTLDSKIKRLGINKYRFKS